MRDEVAVITGAANGIGRHFASEMAKREYRLVLTDIDFAGLSGAFEPNVDLVLLEHDIRDRDRWQKVFDEVETRFGRLDYLFNNAGVIQPGYVWEADLDDIDRQIDVNVKGVMIGTILASRVMREQGRGHIINVASLTGVAPVAGLDIYSASKFAVRGFSLAAAHGLHGSGVAVTVVCPDLVDTAMLDLQLDYDASALAFSGSRSLTVDQVSRALFRAMETRPMEIDLPLSRGLLTKIGNLMPGLATLLTRTLTAKGLKTINRMRRERDEARGS